MPGLSLCSLKQNIFLKSEELKYKLLLAFFGEKSLLEDILESSACLISKLTYLGWTTKQTSNATGTGLKQSHDENNNIHDYSKLGQNLGL